MFAQTFGGALFVSVGQNVFQNRLLSNVQAAVPDFPAYIVLQTGATQVQHTVPPQFLQGVLYAYNKALTETWYVALAMSAISGFGVVWIQWLSVKGKKIEMAVA
jgi:hypothetical protein